MDKADFAKFSKLMNAILSMYNRQWSEEAISMAFVNLQDLSLKQVNDGLQRHVRVCRYAPTVADIREATYGTEDDRSLEAWMAVQKTMRRHGSMASVRFWEPAVHYAIEGLGGWSSFCRSSDYQLEQKFRQYYLSGLRRHISWEDVRRYLPGEEEVRNFSWADRLPVVREIGPSGDQTNALKRLSPGEILSQVGDGADGRMEVSSNETAKLGIAAI